MEKNEILSVVNEIFCDVLDNENIEVTNSTFADDIEEWDSLTNIQLVVAIEKKMGVKFISSEIMKWNNVGEMVDSIYLKLLK